MFINETRKYVYKNAKYIALLILLLILFFLNVEKQNRLNELLIDKGIQGTYIMGNEISGDAEYLVFDETNYYRYRQFNFLDKGEYENINRNVYVLKKEPKEYIVYNKQEIYFFNLKQDSVQFYTKIKDVPLFINVPDRN
nr:hypothetical protein [Sedimentibacter sp.]